MINDSLLTYYCANHYDILVDIDGDQGSSRLDDGIVACGAVGARLAPRTASYMLVIAAATRRHLGAQQRAEVVPQAEQGIIKRDRTGPVGSHDSRVDMFDGVER